MKEDEAFNLAAACFLPTICMKIKMGGLFRGKFMLKAYGNKCGSRVAPEVMNFRNAL